MRERLLSLVLFVAACLVAIAFAEIGLRVLATKGTHGVYMMSHPSMQVAPDGFVRYASKTRIRSVAVDATGIIYDVYFSTNDFGLIDTVDYASLSGRFNVVLVGDSFTAGYHGGSPWINELRNHLDKDIAVFNLGVEGTGIQEFERRLDALAARIPIDLIIVLPISNDFFRRPWFPAASDGQLWFCAETESAADCIANKPPTFHALELDASPADVTENATAVFAQRKPTEPSFRVYSLVKDVLWGLRVNSSIQRAADPEVQTSLQILSGIAARYGQDRFLVVHLPEKHEALSGAYDIAIADMATDLGIKYLALQERCPMSKAMYFDRDPHPNASGYSHIARCLAEIVTELAAARRPI